MLVNASPPGESLCQRHSGAERRGDELPRSIQRPVENLDEAIFSIDARDLMMV